MQVLHGLDLDVPPGRITALAGANGAGKTSAIMTIAGHVELQGGTITLDGKDFSRLPAYERVREGMALAPEGRRLFNDLTVNENLNVGGITRATQEAARNKDYVLELFPRLRERMTQAAGTLSGGEQQMLAIGRALMAKPRILMIDELSLGLMPMMIDLCYEALGRLRKSGIAVLLVEQSMERMLDVADDVCILESGRAVWKGSSSEARANPDLAALYFGET
jgi:branched-chain amino acid transport system ATP-binding protein